VNTSATSSTSETSDAGAGVVRDDSSTLPSSRTDAHDVVIGVALVDVLLRDERHPIEQPYRQRRRLIETASEFKPHAITCRSMVSLPSTALKMPSRRLTSLVSM